MKAVSFALLLVLAFGVGTAFADTPPLKVVASFSIVGDMVQRIGGPDVLVTTLVGANSDTHSYDPSPKDARSISEAKLLFINGLGFEGWMPRLASAASFKGQTITVSDGINPRVVVSPTPLSSHSKSVATIDPHAWQDLSNGLIYIKNITAALEAALPDKKEAIEKRAHSYEQQVRDLDLKIRQDCALIPESKRHIITSHDAFGYFGDAYGVKFLSPVGVNSEAEPSVTNLTQLLKLMKQEGVHTIFVENMTNTRLAETLSHESGIKIGSKLYSDALSSPEGPAATYLDLFLYNVPKFLDAMNENSL